MLQMSNVSLIKNKESLDALLPSKESFDCLFSSDKIESAKLKQKQLKR